MVWRQVCASSVGDILWYGGQYVPAVLEIYYGMEAKSVSVVLEIYLGMEASMC